MIINQHISEIQAADVPDDIEFSIWSSRNVRSKAGVLMTSRRGADTTPVCGKMISYSPGNEGR